MKNKYLLIVGILILFVGVLVIVTALTFVDNSPGDFSNGTFTSRIFNFDRGSSRVNNENNISINILDVQSYPAVGGNWTVKFNTTGTANLTIGAFNGTTYGFDSPNSSVDLEFLELKCGGEVRNVSVMINGTEIPYDVYLKKKRIEEIRRLLYG